MGRTVQIISGEVRNYCGQVAEAWNSFWFTPRDAFSMSVMRVLVGWMAFYTILVWGIEFEAFFGPDGFNSTTMIENYLLVEEGPWAMSFWYFVPTGWEYPVHYLSLAITFCFMIGLYTRVTSVLSLIVLISYAYRARFANYGLDQINAILTMYLCLADSGAYLSIDRLRKRYRSVKEGLQAKRTALPEKVQPSVATNIATRMAQFHYCVIYLFAGTGKLNGTTWWDGSAMWRTLSNAEYQTLDLTWLAAYPWFMEFMTHLTVAWEVSFAFLIWRPLTRYVMLALGTGMHLGIGMFMGMWTFGLCMIFGYCVFVQPHHMKAIFDYIVQGIFGSKKRVLEVDSSSPAQIKQAAWKKALNLTNTLVIEVDGQRLDSGEGSIDAAVAPVQYAHLPNVVLMDAKQNSRETMHSMFQQHGILSSQTTNLHELQKALKKAPGSAAIVNLQTFDEAEVQHYMTAVMPDCLQQRASVTLFGKAQSKWLNSMLTEDHQQLLSLPCDCSTVVQKLAEAQQSFAQQSQQKKGAGMYAEFVSDDSRSSLVID